jgi:hypothetical protein
MRLKTEKRSNSALRAAGAENPAIRVDTAPLTLSSRVTTMRSPRIRRDAGLLWPILKEIMRRQLVRSGRLEVLRLVNERSEKSFEEQMEDAVSESRSRDPKEQRDRARDMELADIKSRTA